QPIPVDVRIVVASNQPLAEAVERSCFREDLYFRLNFVTIAVPPLRERTDDIPLLVGQILASLRVQLNRELTGISPRFLEKLRAHHWPGNVRELQHVIGQAALREDGSELQGHYFTPQVRSAAAVLAGSVAARQPRNAAERQTLARQAVSRTRGNKSLAAESLGVSRKTLYAWLRGQE
ncbi:MAG: Fis family transcriptional regulator, partial [Planctomycetes bacterium]|nr:Fis family transcriptional regulator [Planctomycetota bacterium]